MMRNAEACPDCGVAPGAEHLEGCDVARCLVTGLQRLMCAGDHDCGLDVWSGQWPGTAECVEYGFTLPVTLPGGPLPDLNRLYEQCRWDAGQRRWVLRGQ